MQKIGKINKSDYDAFEALVVRVLGSGRVDYRNGYLWVDVADDSVFKLYQGFVVGFDYAVSKL